MGKLYNPDVRYSFNIPIEDKPQQFFWDAYGPWQECSSLCQGEGGRHQGLATGVVQMSCVVGRKARGRRTGRCTGTPESEVQEQREACCGTQCCQALAYLPLFFSKSFSPLSKVDGTKPSGSADRFGVKPVTVCVAAEFGFDLLG